MGEGYSKATVGSDEFGDSEAPNVDELKTLLDKLTLAATVAKKEGGGGDLHAIYSLPEYGDVVEKLNDIPPDSEELLHAISTDKVFVKDILDFMITITQYKRSGTPEYTWMETALREVAASQFPDVEECKESTMLTNAFEDAVTNLCDRIFSTEDPFELDHFARVIRLKDLVSYWTEAPNVDELKTLLDELRSPIDKIRASDSTEGFDLYSLPKYVAAVKKMTEISPDSEELLHAIGTDKVFVKGILNFMISIPDRSGTPEYTWMQNALRKVAASEFPDVDACKESTLLKGVYEDAIIQLCDSIFSTDDPFELDHFIRVIDHRGDFVDYLASL